MTFAYRYTPTRHPDKVKLSVAHVVADFRLPTTERRAVHIAGGPAEALRAATGERAAGELTRPAVHAGVGVAGLVPPLAVRTWTGQKANSSNP